MRSGLTLPQERQVTALYCFRFRKGQNSDETDEMVSPFSLNAAWHSFISVMYNFKFPREKLILSKPFLNFPTMKAFYSL